VKNISLDNGNTYHHIDDVDAVALAWHWDAIARALDEKTREAVTQTAKASQRAWLRAYLAIAPADLIVG
jgi:hypothetical protein